MLIAALTSLRRSVAVDTMSKRATFGFLLAFLVVLVAGFAGNRTCLLPGLDGAAWRIILDAQSTDRVALSYAGVDPYAGSFDAYHPVPYEYLLPSALTALVSGTMPDRTTTYSIYAAFMLLATFLLARTVGFDRPIALLASLFLPLMSLPFFVHSAGLFYPLFAFNPHISQLVGLSLVIVACFWALDTAGHPLRLLLIPVPALCLTVAILGLVPYVVLIVPATAMYGGASFLVAPWSRSNLSRLTAGLLMIALPASLGMATYIRGLIGYTAYQFFSGEFEQTRSDLIYASSWWVGSFGKITIVLGLMGALWLLLSGSGKLRVLAGTHLAATALFLAVAVLIVRFATTYQGPSPVYFEICFWPYSLLFGAVVIVDGARATNRLLRRRRSPSPSWLAKLTVNVGLTLIVVLVVVIDMGRIFSVPEVCTSYGFSPIRSTPITEKLQSSIALVPGAPFRGIAATIDGIQERPAVNWYPDLFVYDVLTWRQRGNEHRSVGLWNFTVPTLFQYFTFITPPYYLMLTDFLARPTDRQSRSVVVLTRINAPIMRLWGVRYVITDTDTDAGTEVAAVDGIDHHKQRLIELALPNIGNYSPTAVQQAEDFHTGLLTMHDAGFDGSQTVVTEAHLSGPFISAYDASLVYEKYGFHLTAESSGRSILVLPIQYSHCWTAIGTGAPRLFRADLMQLGVDFQGRLDMRLTFQFGPIFAGRCRMEDMADMDRLKISQARDGALRPRALP